MFIWITTPEGKQVFTNDHEVDPCEVCGEFLGTCRMNSCLDDRPEDDYGCIICGAERSSACRCDSAYEDWAGK